MTERPNRPGRLIAETSGIPANLRADPIISGEAPPVDELRGAPREEDPRIRAAERAREIRESLDGEEEGDRFSVPRNEIPEGWCYEWKRHSTYGKADPAYEVELARRGWTPVPAPRHRALMPSGWSGAVIEREGMILMERPQEITDEIRRMENLRARQQVRAKEEQLNDAPPGHFERVDARNKPTTTIKKSLEPMPVARD